jgi:hypothetical protein
VAKANTQVGSDVMKSRKKSKKKKEPFNVMLYMNKITGAVYTGAAILIIIVGLRGLGTLAGELEVVPRFLIDAEGKIDANFVVGGLFLEFVMLLIMALATFMAPTGYEKGADDHKEAESGGGGETPVVSELAKTINDVKKLTNDELQTIDDFVTKFNVLNKKITKMQMESLNALNEMKETITK